MSWQEQLRSGVRTAPELAALLHLSPEEEARYKQLIDRFPVLIPPYYLALADLENPDDPIRRMCVPSFDELNPDGSFDTSGEATNTKLEGLQHKYTPTALLLSTNQCAMYCRHCFRKRLVGLSNEELSKRVDDAVDYLKAHTEITNILVSGGDAFMNPNSILERYLRELTAIDHLDFIRFGSRTPVTLPERIYGDPEFLEIFSRYAGKKAIVLVTQFNHPKELTEEAARAVHAMTGMGIAVRNQTVLLRGVNDDPETLGALLRGLTRMGAAPYYVFQCRPVTGVKGRFQVPLRESAAIVEKAKAQQNGLGKGFRFAMSHPRGKIEILGEDESGAMLFKFHQSKYPEDAGRIFSRRLSSGDTWLDDGLKPV